MKVKICCISSVVEANLAIKSGATELGLVGPMPSGPGVISEAQITEIVKNIPDSINTFFLTSEVSSHTIIEQHKRVNTSTIQIVDKLEIGSYADIRSAIPEVKLVQVIHVIDENNIAEAQMIAPEVDYILLDSGNPNKAIKELGGTGRTHNWEISREIVQSVSIPVFLAGGLNPDNVRQAIDMVQPYGLDLCSGVRVDNKLNHDKLNLFFNHIHRSST